MAKDIEVRRDNASMRYPSLTDSFQEMSRMMDNFFQNPFTPWMPDISQFSKRYLTDVKETDQYYLLTAELPGVPKDDIDVNVSGNILTIHAEHKQEQSEEQSFSREYRSFHQSFSLPSHVDASQIEAHCDNGLLEVILPKTKEAQSQQIKVQSGRGSFMNRLLGKTTEASQKSEGAKH